MTKKELVKLWHETQVGHYKKCREKQTEFSTDLLIISDEQKDN